MSRENIELAKRFYPGTTDLVPLLAEPDALIEFFEPIVHPRFEMVGEGLAMSGASIKNPTDESMRRTVYGVQGFVEVWRDFLSAWETWVATATEFIEVDKERVLVSLDIRARSKTHRVEIPIAGANLLTFGDGRLTRLELFLRRAEALEAAGLSE